MLPANPNEGVSFLIPSAPRQQGMRSERETSKHSLAAFWEMLGDAGTCITLCKVQPLGGLERASALTVENLPHSDAAVEITLEKLLTRFKEVICKKVIFLLLVLGFSLLSKAGEKITCC